MTSKQIQALAVKLAAHPDVARLALASAWHPDFTDKQYAQLKAQIRLLQQERTALQHWDSTES